MSGLFNGHEQCPACNMPKVACKGTPDCFKAAGLNKQSTRNEAKIREYLGAIEYHSGEWARMSGDVIKTADFRSFRGLVESFLNGIDENL